MRRILFSVVLLLFTSAAFSQVVFDLGLKAGVHASNLSIEEGKLLDENGMTLNSNSFAKLHWGAFGRIGFGKIYLQPEVYYSKKGGELSSNILDLTSDFDYNNIDVPLLLGFKVTEGEILDFRLMAGPVFSFVTDADYPVELDPYLRDEFFDDHLIGIQYGLGIDISNFTFDLRMEHNSNIYDDPDVVTGNATTFIFTVGFKIL